MDINMNKNGLTVKFDDLGFFQTSSDEKVSIIKPLDLEEPHPITNEFKEQEKAFISKAQKHLKTKYKLDTKVWFKYDSLQIIIDVKKPVPQVWVGKIEDDLEQISKKYSEVNRYYHAFNDLQPYPFVIRKPKPKNEEERFEQFKEFFAQLVNDDRKE